MRFGLLLATVSLLVHCTEPKSPKTVDEFGKQHYELFAKRITECSGADEAALLWLLDIDQYKTKLSHSLTQKRVAYDRVQAAKCLDELAKADCSKLRDPLLPGGSCVLAIAGQVKLGDDCFELADYEECAPANFCSALSACAGICTAPVKLGGNCGSGTSCEVGTQCIAGICRKNAGEGKACQGNTGIICADTFVCLGGDATTVGVCSQPLTSGECRILSSGQDANDCALGFNCQLGLAADETTATQMCQKSLAAGEACVPGRYQCANYLACVQAGNGAYSCQPYPVEGAECGYFIDDTRQFDYEYVFCIQSWCDAANPSFQTPKTQRGTCRTQLGAGETCTSSTQCGGGTTCDAITETCVAACPLQ